MGAFVMGMMLYGAIGALILWKNYLKILEDFEIKPKTLYITLREILTGKKFGPSMNDILTLMKKDEIMKRVETNCEEED